MKFRLAYNKREISAAGSIIALAFLLLAASFCSAFSPVALAEEAAPPEQIILTWSGELATSQTITWLMPSNSPARIQYIMADEFTGSFDSAQQINAKSAAFDSTQYRYTVNISGLTPDTKYIYRVGNEGAWSETLSFTTAADTEKFSFLYMGDVQAGYSEWGSMLNLVYQAYPQIKFSLLGGDLTDNGSNEIEWGQFLSAATGVFSRIPVMPTMGNHDGAMYSKFFALPDNGPAGWKQEFYSFDYGNAHFVMLDTSKNTDEEVKRWLREDLQNTTKKWKFAVFHIPAYPASRDYKGIDKSICDNWVPILEQNRVDMAFVGHQHEYMRTYPIYQGEVQTDPAAYGIVYVMGNAGTKTYAAGEGFSYIAREQTGSNYQLININGDVLTLTAKKANGELIESYTINKSGSAAPALTPDVTDNVVGQTIELTFADDAAWRAAITRVSVDGVALKAGQYSKDTAGKITINGEVFNSAREYAIVIKATGYQDVTVTQKMSAPVTLTTPVSGQEYMKGQPVIIKGTVEGNLTILNIKVTAPDGQVVYGPKEVGVAGGKFETSFKLDSSAKAGTYIITVDGIGLSGVIIGKFSVKADNAIVEPVGDVVLTITGSGVDKEVKLTLNQLQAMEPYRQVYSAINTWPTKKWYVGEGVKLKDLLNLAGMQGNAGLIKFSAVDGYTVTLTVQELLRDTRYYFPQFKSGGSDGDGHVPGSPGGAKAVETIIALVSAEGTDNPGYINDLDALLLMMGQRAVTEQTGQLFVKRVSKIEVLATSPQKWDNPQANPGSGEIPAGTMVKLSNAHMDDDKIYYTTDGSTPTMNSPMYNWIASRWWSSRADVVDTINHPLEIKEKTTIKAITIGPGRADSDVVTFSYQVKEVVTSKTETITPSIGGTISLGSEAIIEIPANALKETSAVEVKIEKVTTPPAVPTGFKLAGSVYEFSVGGQNSYSFAKKVTIKLSFDPNAVNGGETPAIHYYDEAQAQWVNIGGTVSGNTVTVQVDHFTKFAVMIPDKSVATGIIISGKGGTISLGSEATIEIPAGAITNAEKAEVKIERVTTSPDVPVGFKLVGSVYEFSVDGQNSYSFAKKVTIKLSFDPNAVSTGEIPAIYYYDQALSQWVNIGGNVSGNIITVQVDHFTKFAILAAEKEPKKLILTDITGHWAQKNIEKLVALGAISGYPDGSFKPDSTITRAEFATVLVKAFKLQNQGGRIFADTAAHWAKDYIAIAAANGVVKGYDTDTFAPDDLITREQMAVIIATAAKLAPVAEETQFADTGRISGWARDAVAAVTRNGIIKGYPDNTIQPQNSATRAEAVTVIVNALNKFNK